MKPTPYQLKLMDKISRLMDLVEIMERKSVKAKSFDSKYEYLAEIDKMRDELELLENKVVAIEDSKK